MAITEYKIVYKNHCTPQEQITSGGRYHMDSDCNRRLTGIGTDTALTAVGALTSSASITTTPTQVANNKDFVFVKNTSDIDVYVSVDEEGLAGGGSSNGNYLIRLSKGEAFASKITTDADVYVKTSSGIATVDYFSVT